ncbi:MAG: hypothetical protein J7K54_01865 [Candidatus Aenigmarchaeota archaeon]|nr:hypothetical protein [Candidatus Aenigmarchaeota archaeon]
MSLFRKLLQKNERKGSGSTGYRSVIDNIKDDTEGAVTFLHNTANEDAVNSIINDGFLYADNLHTTADRFTRLDDISMSRWEQERNFYGPYTVVIQISNETYEKLMNNKKYAEKQLLPEHLLSVEREFNKDEGEFVYRLPNKFVKGYINRETGEFHPNPDFDPSYFDENTAQRNYSHWDFNQERVIIYKPADVSALM